MYCIVLYCIVLLSDEHAESQRTLLAAAFKHALDVRRSTIRKLTEAQWVPLAKGTTAVIQ